MKTSTLFAAIGLLFSNTAVPTPAIKLTHAETENVINMQGQPVTMAKVGVINSGDCTIDSIRFDFAGLSFPYNKPLPVGHPMRIVRPGAQGGLESITVWAGGISRRYEAAELAN